MIVTEKIANNKNLGFQVSASKTFAVDTNTMWEFILSEQGICIWLGTINIDDFEVQKQLYTKEGIAVKLTVFKMDCHLRFKWKPPHFAKDSTVELRITNSNGRAKVIFHNTGFYKIEQQETLRIYWKNVIAKMHQALMC
jgi:activator of HSP90 ATPase